MSSFLSSVATWQCIISGCASDEDHEIYDNKMILIPRKIDLPECFVLCHNDLTIIYIFFY